MSAKNLEAIECDCKIKIVEKPCFQTIRKLISGLRFFPKTHDFFSYYERSSENTVKGAKLLCEMIENKDRRAELSKKLKDYEHIGDDITHEVINLLRDTFLTPFDRHDMYTLAKKLDDVLDIIYYVGNRLTRYNIEKMPGGVAELAGLLCKSTEELTKALTGLKDPKHHQNVLKHCVEINRLENEADEQVNFLIEELFSSRWESMEVIKIKELVENLEEAADKSEDVANIIEGIILKHT